MSKTTIKPKVSKIDQYRDERHFQLGVETAKRTISKSMRRTYWLKGFCVGLAVGALITCAARWVSCL
jgi:hypothetical protein